MFKPSCKRGNQKLYLRWKLRPRPANRLKSIISNGWNEMGHTKSNSYKAALGKPKGSQQSRNRNNSTSSKSQEEKFSCFTQIKQEICLIRAKMTWCCHRRIRRSTKTWNVWFSGKSQLVIFVVFGRPGIQNAVKPYKITTIWVTFRPSYDVLL